MKFKVFIRDEPSFEHRGVSIDTSRFFVSTTSLKLLLEAMSRVKLNVLRWKFASGDGGFKFKSKRFPELAKYVIRRHRWWVGEKCKLPSAV